ncbi:MBL fold metallo-hydrolase [Jannaschia sp. W003]|uniref:MBL fold metallo-hydrolase n=1 Tax=Jannaschia sp. W003 TaxID=2867012 RepID=UPI0021A79A90|nr:MBL fold metallo-hydrolase [Jannaschia sp. W003]UWQ22437.1 MBL fold metallo-hydrolase [Jannaschia sp. W003]
MSDSERTERHSPSKGPGSPDVWGFYDPPTGSAQYVVACPETRKAALVDVVQDFDPAGFSTGTEARDQAIAIVEREGLTVEWVLDTHPHADHFTASVQLAGRFGVPNAIGTKVREIAELWRGLYNMPDAFDVDRDYARLFADDDTFRIGKLDVRVMLSPGHTLGSITYVVGEDAAFVHDTLMQPDQGTARCDFPGGSAAELWASIQAILALPESTRLFIGHDYPGDDRDAPEWEATVAEHLERNVHVKRGTDRDAWIAKREKRDATLALPDRMLAALQVNLRAGQLPPPEDDGHSYLKMPLNKF